MGIKSTFEADTSVQQITYRPDTGQVVITHVTKAAGYDSKTGTMVLDSAASANFAKRYSAALTELVEGATAEVFNANVAPATGEAPVVVEKDTSVVDAIVAAEVTKALKDERKAVKDAAEAAVAAEAVIKG